MKEYNKVRNSNQQEEEARNYQDTKEETKAYRSGKICVIVVDQPCQDLVLQNIRYRINITTMLHKRISKLYIDFIL